MTIYSTSFDLKPVTSGYDLTINFLNQNKEVLSKHVTHFQFSSKKKEEGALVDIFTKNSTISSTDPIKGIFLNKDVKEIKNAKMKSTSSNPTIMVLDLKNKESHYIDQENTISKSEKAVYQLLIKKEPSISKSANQVCKELNNLNFILFEGSLKKDLLQNAGFSKKEITHLNSTEGATDFCQVAEFFMNAFKFGHKAFANNCKFSKKQYIKSLNGQSFKPYKKQTVLYPKEYKTLYSATSTFSKTLSPIFSIQGSYCEKTSITTLNYEENNLCTTN